MFDFNIKTLRDTLQFKYDISVNYRELLNHSDIPYEFDRVNKPLWRWHYHSSGTFYSRIHANYSIWFNNHFKKKIGVFMPIYWKIPHKREKVWGPWPKKYYIYENSYRKNIYNQNNYNYKKLQFKNNNLKNLNYYFYNYNYYKSTIITNYSSLFEHSLIRSYKPFSYFGYENNMFFSGYNYKWHNLYFRDTFYHQFLINPNFVIPVNHFLMCGSFIINSYDSDIILHPYVFLKNDYYIRYYRAINLLNNFNIIFNKKINLKFLYNIINLINKIYKNNIINMLMSFNLKFKYLSNEYYIYILYLFYLYKFILNKKNNIFYFNKINIFLNNKLSLFNDNLLFKKIFNNIKYFKYNNNIVYHYFFKLLNNKYYNYNIYYNYKLLFNSKLFNKIYWNRDVNSINFWIKNLEILKEKFLSKNLSKFIRKIYYNRIRNLNIIFFNLKKLYIKNKNNIYNFFKLKNIIKKINLKVKRYTTYDKIFAIVPFKYKYINDKCTIILNTKDNWNSTLWSKYFSGYNRKIKIFIYKYFNFFTNLLKFNFGFYYNLNYYNNENLKNIDMNFFISVQLLIYKFFTWFKYWRKFIYKISLRKKYSKILYKNIFMNLLNYKKKYYNLLNYNKLYYNILKNNNNIKNKTNKYIYG